VPAPRPPDSVPVASGAADQAITLVAPGDVERVLVVTAHPDDVDFGAAGSVAAWVKAGTHVAYCIVTDGDAGGSDLSVSRPDMAALRREEQRAAAAEVGVDDVTFLGFPDGRLVPSIELRRDISREIRRVRPDRVVCQSPERNWDRIVASHPDHLAAGEAAVCAVYPDARNPFAHPELLDEGLEPFSVPEVWLMASPASNRGVEITDTFDQKLRALRRHESQVGDGEFLDGLLRGWFGPQAVAAGLPAGSLAELFRAVATG
jgi:LmbE family N-acetylglucosaminyl deacetylase